MASLKKRNCIHVPISPVFQYLCLLDLWCHAPRLHPDHWLPSHWPDVCWLRPWKGHLPWVTHFHSIKKLALEKTHLIISFLSSSRCRYSHHARICAYHARHPTNHAPTTQEEVNPSACFQLDAALLLFALYHIWKIKINLTTTVSKIIIENISINRLHAPWLCVIRQKRTIKVGKIFPNEKERGKK